MTSLGSKFISEDPDARGQTGPASTVPGPAGADSTVPGPAGVVATVVAGTNITVDNTDPANPIVAATAGGADPLTTKGDVFGFDTDAARIPVGANDEVLTADSTAALGVAWKAPAASGVGAMVTFIVQDSAKAFSGSSFAAKGVTFNCINNITMHHVTSIAATDSAATYKLVIAEVSGATDVIDAITAISDNITAATTAANPQQRFTFASGVSLVAGKRYAFITVRTDGTSTSINRSSFPSLVGSSIQDLIYVASIRYATLTPAISDVTRFATNSSVHHTYFYTVD